MALFISLLYMLLDLWQVNFCYFGDPDALLPMLALARNLHITSPIKIFLSGCGNGKRFAAWQGHIDVITKTFGYC